MHFVFVRFSSIGDIILQMPTVSWFRFRYPKAKITFITSAEFKGLISNHPHIDHVITYDRVDKNSTFKRLIGLKNKIGKADLLIDLHGTTRSFLLKIICYDLPQITIDKRRIERFLLTKFKINFLSKTASIHTRNLLDFQSIFSFDQSTLKKFINSSFSNSDSLTSFAIQEFQDFKFSQNIIVFSPGASFESKIWPIENFLVLLKKLLNDIDFSSFTFICLAGPKDTYCELLNEVNDSRFINLQGKTSFNQSAYIISQAKLFIGNDSGMGHIAEACGVDTISIFGSTSTSFGFAPHRTRSEALTANISCSPCSQTGKKPCHRKKHLCMDLITPSIVLDKISQRLK